MKTLTQSLLAGVVIAASFAATAHAQYPAEFTKQQADSTIALRRSEISNLSADIDRAKSDAATATSDYNQRAADFTACQDALYTMMGTDRAGYNAYRERLARDEQELASLRSLGNDKLAQNAPRVTALETEIRSMRGNKIVLTRDHMARVGALSNNFMMMKKGMMPPSMMYTVGTWRKDRDCLWNIAKKPDIYNDPFAWPKIWHANMEQIHNPDIIHPGMQLTIAKTAVTEQDKDLTGYRHRRK